MQISARHILFAALAATALWMVRGFLLPLAWGVILAITLWPLYQRWISRRPTAGKPLLIPLVFTFATGLLLIMPLAVAAIEAAVDSHIVLSWLSEVQHTGIPPPERLAHLPLIGGRAHAWWQANLADPQAAANAVSRFVMGSAASWIGTIGGEVARRSLALLCGLLALFFLLRDGQPLAQQTLLVARRMLGDFGDHFVRRLTLAVRETVGGTVIVALGEGVVIGIGYAVAGVPRPVLFAVLTAAFAMLPFGAWIMFTAASAILLAHGLVLAAVLLFLYGATVMMIGDNLVLPYLIGSSTRLPFIWALIGTFGGLETFGLVGLFLGPVIIVALLVGWREWIEHGNGRTAEP
ncbi:AI-2E family transporter [Sphingomonas sp. DBB INV C78]|uniref:AI-2E family transporter n=1 Tax=Sphingomonas sp. DBB INV C78 TaxID=3349434 RepID=UPI0036D219BC